MAQHEGSRLRPRGYNRLKEESRWTHENCRAGAERANDRRSEGEQRTGKEKRGERKRKLEKQSDHERRLEGGRKRHLAVVEEPLQVLLDGEAEDRYGWLAPIPVEARV